MDKFEIAELVQNQHCQVRVYQARTSILSNGRRPDLTLNFDCPTLEFDWIEKFPTLEKAKAALLARPNVRFVNNKGRCGTYAYDVEGGKAEIVDAQVNLRELLGGNLKLLGYTIDCPDTGHTYTYRAYPKGTTNDETS